MVRWVCKLDDTSTHLDLDKWVELVEEEARIRAEMRAFAENYVELAEYMDYQGLIESEEDDDE